MAYATSTDLTRLGLSSEGLADVSSTTIDAMLTACSAKVDDYIEAGGRYSPPLTTYPSSLTLTVCKLAQYELIGVEGYYPEEGTEQVLLQRYEQAMNELERLGRGGALSGVTDATPGVSDDDPVIDSDDEREWGFGESSSGTGVSEIDDW